MSDILQATTKNCIFFQGESARRYAAARWERDHGAMSRTAALQERAAYDADEARIRLDRINGHA